MNYWKGWAVITAVYVIAWIWQHRSYKRELMTKELQVEMLKRVNEITLKHLTNIRKRYEELEGNGGKE